MRSSLILFLGAIGGAVAQGENCSPLQIVWARATGEPPRGGLGEDIETKAGFEAAAAKTPTKGYGSVGNTIITRITPLIQGTSAYAVHYIANSTWVYSMGKGAADMADHMKKQSIACPKQKFVMGGHSQGGYVTTQTIARLPRDVQEKIVAITMFGSPACPRGGTWAERCRSYCNFGDWVCDAANAPPGANPLQNKGGAGVAKAPGGVGGAGGMSGKGGKGPALMPAILNVNDDLSNDITLGLAKGFQQAADCTGPEPKMRGYDTGNAKGAHTSYVRDGVYINAALCFIQKNFKGARA